MIALFIRREGAAVLPSPEITVHETSPGVFIATCERCGHVMVKHTREEIELQAELHICEDFRRDPSD